MAIKTFTTGEVLTASDTNTYLANSGLVYVAGGSFTAASTIDVTGFSSTYKYFRLEFVAKRVDTTGNTTLYAQLYSGATARTTAYYSSAFFTSYLGTTGVGYASNNSSSFLFSLSDSGSPGITAYDIYGMTSEIMTMTGTFFDTGGARQYLSGAIHNVSETNDKLRIVTASPATVTGNWRLYGYREP
jgi:hypothetical protein